MFYIAPAAVNDEAVAVAVVVNTATATTAFVDIVLLSFFWASLWHKYISTTSLAMDLPGVE